MGGLDGLTAAVSGGVAMGDFLGSRYLSKEQNSANRALSDEAFSRESKYNSPENQMARLKAAGLNPNLVYGTGTTGITGNTHASIPSYTPGANPGKIVGDSIDKYLSTERMRLDNDIARRTAKNLDVQNVKMAKEVENLNTDNRIKTAAAILAEHENGLISDTPSSVRDPWYSRMGGRVGSALKDIYEANQVSSDADRAIRSVPRPYKSVDLEFDETKRSRYTPRKAAREVHYKYD